MGSSLRQQFKLILGSSSVSRRKILADMGFEFTTMYADIDEKAIRKEKPEDLVMAIAEAKADAIVAKLKNIESHENYDKSTLVITADTVDNSRPNHHGQEVAEPTVLITCDQVVVYEGTVREKPSNKEEAREFLKGYSGGHAATMSSVIVTNLRTGLRKGDWDRVEIHFRDISEPAIEKLIEEGVVLTVAGGLLIEHPLIVPCVKEVMGETESVMGLPISVTRKLIEEVL